MDTESVILQLKDVRRQLFRLQPAGGRDDPDEILPILLQEVVRKLRLLLKLNGFPDEAREVAAILEKNRKDLYFRIQVSPWEGEYLVVREILDYIEAVGFALGAETGFRQQGALTLLLSVLQGVQRTFPISQKYPQNERDLEVLVESVLISYFPALNRDPVIEGNVKLYHPDTGIPEASTLIEYKYIADKRSVPKTLEQLYADAVGYRDMRWQQLVCVVYETERFVNEAAWMRAIKKIERADFVLLRGVPREGAGRPDPPMRRAARPRRR